MAISVLHGGCDDIRRHVGSKRHSYGHCEGEFFEYPVYLFYQARDERGFIVEHNLPIAVADHAGPLFRKMFPDSKVASKYGCARTKTSAIIGELSNMTLLHPLLIFSQ